MAGQNLQLQPLIPLVLVAARRVSAELYPRWFEERQRQAQRRSRTA